MDVHSGFFRKERRSGRIPGKVDSFGSSVDRIGLFVDQNGATIAILVTTSPIPSSNIDRNGPGTPATVSNVIRKPAVNCLTTFGRMPVAPRVAMVSRS